MRLLYDIKLSHKKYKIKNQTEATRIIGKFRKLDNILERVISRKRRRFVTRRNRLNKK